MQYLTAQTLDCSPLCLQMFSVLVPRLRDLPAPVTCIYRLPTQRLAVHSYTTPRPGLGNEHTRVHELAVLEIAG